MKNPPSESVFLNLRDEYKFSDFTSGQRLRSARLIRDHSFLRLIVAQKNTVQRLALNDVAAFMTNVGGGCVILSAVIAMFIFPSRCAA